MLPKVALSWLAVAALMSAGAALAPSAGWAVVACVAFVGFAVTLARTAPAATVLLAPLLLLRFSEFASGAVIEGGARMGETGATGSATGGFAHRLLIEILFFTAAAWPIERIWARSRPEFEPLLERWRGASDTLLIALAGIIGLSSVLLALLAARHGVPLIGQLDRFTYLGQLEGTPYRTIMMNRVVLAPLLGILLAVPRRRRVGFILLGWLLFLSILFGEKFTSLLMILGGAAIAPLIACLGRRPRLPLRPILGGLVGLAACCAPLILFHYGVLDDPRRAVQKLRERATVQGQLWFLADRAGAPPRLDTPALAADIASWPDPRAQHAERTGPRFGLYYVMARFTPSNRLKQAERGGTGFVFALHPYLLLAGGIPLLLIGGLSVAVAEGWALALLLRSLIEGRWLAALLFARLVSSAYAGLFTGYLWNIIGVKSVATLLLGLALLNAPRFRGLLPKMAIARTPQRAY